VASPSGGVSIEWSQSRLLVYLVAVTQRFLLDDLRLMHFVGLLRHRYGRAQVDVQALKGALAGKTLLLLGNGPSLAKVPNEVLSHFCTSGSNGIFLKFTPDLYITESHEFHVNYAEEIAYLQPSLKFFPSQLRDKGLGGGSPTVYLPTVFPERERTYPYKPVPQPLMFSKDPSRVLDLGGSVLFAQLQTSLFLGAREVVIAGLDHDFELSPGLGAKKAVSLEIENHDSHHFTSDYLPAGSSVSVDLAASERRFMLARKAFERDRVPLWNVTEGTSLQILPQRSLNDFI